MSAVSTPTTAGPSRLPHLGIGQGNTTAASTSGDSESTGLPPPDTGLDISVLKELARSALIEKLNDVPGQKTLILDPALAGPLGAVTEVALLKNQAVDKIFWLESGPLSVGTRNVVWICRPRLHLMRIIAEQIRQQQASSSSGGPQVFTLLLVPRATELCRKVLEDEGVAGDLTISEYKLEFIPLEDDLLSLEMDDVARDIWVNGDDTPIYYSSLALMTFQRAFGLFPRILGKGDAAKRLADLLRRHQASGLPEFSDLEMSTQVDSLIIADRSIDWVTPMCTQLTYDGMLDEYIGIKNGHIEIDPALIDSQNTQPASSSALPSTPLVKKKKHPLSGSKDRLYAEIRDLNFAVVGSQLSRLARRLEGDYGGVKNLKNVREMKEFVGKIGGLQGEQQNLRLHTGLTEQLMPITRTEQFNKMLEAQQNLVAGYDAMAQLSIVEDLMYQQTPWSNVLRGAVLMSLTNGGIKAKNLEAFKRDFLQVYGYHHLPLLVSLQSLGLLVKAPSTIPHPFPALRKSLRLVVDDTNDLQPNDISYVYSGYAPLSIRLVQCITQKNAILSTVPGMPGAGGEEDPSRSSRKELPQAHPIAGWRGFEDALGSIPGATVDIRQKPDPGQAGPGAVAGVGEGKGSRDRDGTTTIVFFLGGCTFTEIAALRWMSKQTKGRKFLIATTGIINGTSLLESFGDRAPAPLHSK